MNILAVHAAAITARIDHCSRALPSFHFPLTHLITMNIRLLSTLALLCALSAPLQAQDTKPDAAAETKPAADASALPKADASDEAAVRALLGQKATITGEVTTSFASDKTGMTFITMAGGTFTVVCWKRSYDKFEGGSPADLYRGKKIEITGMVEEYKGKSGTDAGKLQIKLNEPGQIKITGEATAAGGKDKGKEKDTKEAGKEKGKASGKKKDKDSSKEGGN